MLRDTVRSWGSGKEDTLPSVPEETVVTPEWSADSGGAPGEAVGPTASREIAVDMREVPMLRRLDTILRAWKELRPGDAIRLTNDREPAPLQVLFRTRERGKFDWSYEKEGPTEWVAVIRRKG